jgi:hypothetical protein
MLLIPIYN